MSAQHPQPIPESSWGSMLITALWISLLACAALALASYGATPGVAAEAPSTWPTESHLQGPDERATLVVFVHPECTCARVTLTSLAEMLERMGAPPRVVVVLARPGAGGGDDAGATVRATLPYAELFDDEGEHETRRFGAHTSGQVLLYGANGLLAFAGGITPSRGHAGPNAGRDRLRALLAGEAADRPVHVVFGCSLDRQEGWL